LFYQVKGDCIAGIVSRLEEVEKALSGVDEERGIRSKGI